MNSPDHPTARPPDRWPRLTFPVLAAVAVFLVAAHFATTALESWFVETGAFAEVDTAHELLDRFNLDREAAIPSWFATVLLFACAVVLGLISQDARLREDRRWGYWVALSVFLGLASLDESAAFHELLNPVMGHVFAPEGTFSIGWWLPAGLLLLVTVVVFLQFYLSLEGWVRVRFALALGLFAGGAIIVEVVESFLPQDGSLLLGVLYGLEEGLELAGVIVFLHALRDVRRRQSA